MEKQASCESLSLLESPVIDNQDDEEVTLTDRAVMQSVQGQRRSTKEARLANMFKDDRYADCTVRVVHAESSEDFRVNRTILARSSDVLADIFFGQKPQKNEEDAAEEAHCLEGTSAAFQELLRTAYDLEPDINERNFVDIFRMAQTYEVYDLLDAVDIWMVRTAVSPLPALRAMNHAILTVSEGEEELNQMVGACLKTVASNLETLIDAEALLECSPPTLKLLVLQDYLRCDEEKLLLALVEWEKLHDSGMLQTIAPYMRYSVMSPEFFVDTVVPAGILQPGEVVELLSARTTSRPARGFPNAHLPRNKRPEHGGADDDEQSDSGTEATGSPLQSPLMSGGAWGQAIDPRFFIAANSTNSTSSTPLGSCDGVVVRSALQSARNAFKTSRCRDTPPVPRRPRCDGALRVR
jgi:hypothetical protein